MTKKDYIMVEKAIADSMDNCMADYVNPDKFISARSLELENFAWHLRKNMTELFGKDNPKFNAEQFAKCFHKII